MRLLDALKAKEPLTKEETIRPLISDSQSEVLFAPSFVDLLPVKRYLNLRSNPVLTKQANLCCYCFERMRPFYHLVFLFLSRPHNHSIKILLIVMAIF
jgi:hypothetical protein